MSDWYATAILENRQDIKTLQTTVATPASASNLGGIKVGAGLSVEADGTLSVSPYYGFEIDMSVSDPATCITYTGAAAAMTQAERKAWAYGHVKPTVVKNGEIVYALKRDDLSKKADGTASDLTGTDGDVCATFDALWISATKTAKKITVRLSEFPQAGYIPLSMFNTRARKYNHIGMFEATGTTCDSVYSTTVTPKVSQSLKTFRTQAATKNVGLDEQYAGVYTYLSNVMYSALFIFAYGTLNSQAAVGNGNVSTSAAIAVGKAELLTASGEYGVTNASNTHVMALFVVNPWGNVWKFLEGCMWSGGNFALATDCADLYDIEGGYAGKPSTWHAFATGLGTAISGKFITEFLGDSAAPFFPCAAPTGDGAGASDRYACDFIYTATGDRVCFAGGRWTHGAGSGLFAVGVVSAPAASSADVGARLQVANKD